MDKELNSSPDNNSSNLKDNDNEQSIVGKFKSIINSTPLSKWFRKRDDEDTVLPPSKKFKPPTDPREISCELSFDTPSRPPVKNDTVSANKKFSCFPEPLAGPSGIKHRKTLSSTVTSSVQSAFTSEIFNGHKDTDSEGESTSGYSSVARINSKEHVNRSQGSSKQTSPAQNCVTPNNIRSRFPPSNSTMNRSTLFTEKTASPNINTSMSSRRPSFNVSTFGSPNFMDNTLATKKILNSPFYSGKTVYGGASAYGRSLGRSAQELQTNLQNSIRIKPVNQPQEKKDLMLGKTARRILETLEQYSSPINDAKKIPITPKRQVREGVFSKFIGAHPYSTKHSRVASNRELQVPTIPELLQMKKKTQLQDSTESVKQIAKSSKSDLNVESYKLSTTDTEKEKHTGKMRTKVASVRQKSYANEVVSEVNLNPVSLPITTLPKFDLVIPPPAAAAVAVTTSIAKITEKPISTPSSNLFSTASTFTVNAPPITQKTKTDKTVQIDKQTSPVVEYHFPKPIVISENLKSIVAYNNFKFSEPISKKAKVDVEPIKASSSNDTLNFKMPENKLPTLVPNKSKNNGETLAKAASTLLTTGSVMDVLGKKKSDSLLDKFKPATGSWECSTCMVRNDGDKATCVACETPKEKPVAKTLPEPEAKKCTKPSNPIPRQFEGFGTTFTTPSDVWECPTCMIKNKNELSNCAACETPKNKPESTSASLAKPSIGATNSFGAAFAIKSDQWECGVCMVRNKSADLKCVSCSTDKPESSNKDTPKGASENKSSLQFNFAVDKSAAATFSFGIPASAAVTMPSSSLNASSVFGDQSKPAVTSTSNTFTFGIPKTTEVTKPTETSQSNQATNPLLKPTEKLPEPAKPAGTGFTFGIPSSGTASKENEPKPIVSSSSDVQKSVFSPKTSNLFNNKSESSPGFGMSSAAAAPVNMFNFNSKPTAAATLLTSQNAFTSNTDRVTPVSSLNSLGESKPTVPVFSFGKQSNTETSKLFNSAESPKFGVDSGNKPTGNMFGMKRPADNVSMFGSPKLSDKSAGSTFGSNPADTTTPLFSASAKPEGNTLFGGSPKPVDSVTPSFGSVPKPAEIPSPFSAAATKPAETPAPVFGNSIKSTEPSSSVFGSSSTNQGFGNNGFVNTPLPSIFGNGSAPSFGVTALPTASEVKPFSFKSDTSSNKEAAMAPVFAFGAGTASGIPQAQPFAFTPSVTPAASTQPVLPSPGFNFTGFSGTPAPAFGANNLAANSTTNKNGTFSFGSTSSSTDTQKVGFTFGAPAEKPASSSGFNFTSTIPAPSSGGFNFSGAPPTFDSSAKPSFKFTDGSITSFSAQQSTEGEAGKPLRKIKRGIRRTTQR